MDVPHDNMLDSAEFSAAMHLIQLKMRGIKVPMTLPAHLRIPPKEEVQLPPMKDKDLAAYKGLFYHVAAGKKTLDGKSILKIFIVYIEFMIGHHYFADCS